MSRRRLTREGIDRWLEFGIDIEARHLLLEGEIDDDMLTLVAKAFHVFNTQRSDQPVTIVLNSTGGDVEAGLGIYDIISLAIPHVTIRVIGSAQSMAAVVLQAADHRQVSIRSYLMVHEGSTSVPDNHVKNARSLLKWEQHLADVADDILLDSITEVKGKFTRRQLAKKQEFDWYLDANEAVAWGLADEVY